MEGPEVVRPIGNVAPAVGLEPATDVPTSVAGAMVLVHTGPARPHEPRKNV